MTRTALLAFAFLSACGPAQAVETPRCGYKVKRVYPHDEHAFTQGLLYRNGFLFESTGLDGQSTIRMVRLANGQVVRSVAIPPTLFGEGNRLPQPSIYDLRDYGAFLEGLLPDLEFVERGKR